MAEIVAPTEQLDWTQEIGDIEVRFNRALFERGDGQSVFTAHPDDERARPSSIVLAKEKALIEASHQFFAFLREIVNQPAERSYIPNKTISFNNDELTTFARANVEKKQNPQHKTYPYPQLWISASEPIELDKQREPRNWAQRLDNSLDSFREQLVSHFAKLAATNTPQAAEQRSRLMRALTDIAKRPIEVHTIMYQQVEAKMVFTPQIGISLVKYLDGYQVFPLIYEGRESFRLYDRPLFSGQAVKIEELGSTIEELSLITQEELAATPLKKVFDEIFSRVDFKGLAASRRV